MKQISHKIRNASASRGFTLIELMISIAIALLLMIGVGAVFRTASDTIGFGQAEALISRIDRNVQYTMGEDFANMAHDGPVLAIRYHAGDSYLSLQDYMSSGAVLGDPYASSFDPTGTGTFGAVKTVTALYNNYSHRTDSISFFVRGNYSRKALASGFIDTSGQASSDEAWVWYGLLALANHQPLINIGTAPTYYLPSCFYGSGGVAQGSFSPTTNPNNAFGVNWVLGRVAILLRPDANLDVANGYLPAPTSAAGYPMSPLASDSPVALPVSSSVFTGSQTPTQMSPVSWGSEAYPTNYGKWTIESGICDLGQTSITNFSQAVISQISTESSGIGQYWWCQMIGYPNTGSVASGFGSNYFNSPGSCEGRFFNAYSWMPKPLNPANNAQFAFNLVPGCTQFIVEYAGDFLNQNPTTGQVLNTYTNPGRSTTIAPTDGLVDFIVDPNPDWTSTNNSVTKRIRWYGMPRDVAPLYTTTSLPPNPPPVFAPDGSIPCTPVANVNGGTALPDVVPLYDLWRTVSGAGNMAPFERDWFWTPGSSGYSTDYAIAKPAGSSIMGESGFDCVWGPNDRRPTLIRITIVVNDPNRRLHDGRTLEYVFNVN